MQRQGQSPCGCCLCPIAQKIKFVFKARNELERATFRSQKNRQRHRHRHRHPRAAGPQMCSIVAVQLVGNVTTTHVVILLINDVRDRKILGRVVFKDFLHLGPVRRFQSRPTLQFVALKTVVSICTSPLSINTSASTSFSLYCTATAPRGSQSSQCQLRYGPSRRLETHSCYFKLCQCTLPPSLASSKIAHHLKISCP